MSRMVNDTKIIMEGMVAHSSVCGDLDNSRPKKQSNDTPEENCKQRQHIKELLDTQKSKDKEHVRVRRVDVVCDTYGS